MTSGGLPVVELEGGRGGGNGRSGATSMSEEIPLDIYPNPFDDSMFPSSSFAVSQQCQAGENHFADSDAFLSILNRIDSTGGRFSWNDDALSLPTLQSFVADSAELPAVGENFEFMANYDDVFSLPQPQIAPFTPNVSASSNWGADVEIMSSPSENSIANNDLFDLNQWPLPTPGSEQVFIDMPSNDDTVSTNTFESADNWVQKIVTLPTHCQSAGNSTASPLHQGPLLTTNTEPGGSSTSESQVRITPLFGKTPDVELPGAGLPATSQREEAPDLGSDFDVNSNFSLVSSAPHFTSCSSSCDSPHITLPPYTVTTVNFNQGMKGKSGSIAHTTIVPSASGPVLSTSTGKAHQSLDLNQPFHSTIANASGTQFGFDDKRSQDPDGAKGNGAENVGSNENRNAISLSSPTGTMGGMNDSQSPPSVGIGSRSLTESSSNKAITQEDGRGQLLQSTLVSLSGSGESGNNFGFSPPTEAESLSNIADRENVSSFEAALSNLDSQQSAIPESSLDRSKPEQAAITFPPPPQSTRGTQSRRQRPPGDAIQDQVPKQSFDVDFPGQTHSFTKFSVPSHSASLPFSQSASLFKSCPHVSPQQQPESNMELGLGQKRQENRFPSCDLSATVSPIRVRETLISEQPAPLGFQNEKTRQQLTFEAQHDITQQQNREEIAPAPQLGGSQGPRQAGHFAPQQQQSVSQLELQHTTQEVQPQQVSPQQRDTFSPHDIGNNTPEASEQVPSPGPPQPLPTVPLSPLAFADLVPLALMPQKSKLKMEDDLTVRSLTESRTEAKKFEKKTVPTLNDLKTMSAGRKLKPPSGDNFISFDEEG